MPDIQTIEVSYQRKVQLDDFEPVAHTATLYAELSDGEDEDEAYDELRDRAEQMVERAIAGRVTQKKLQEGGDEDDE